MNVVNFFLYKFSQQHYQAHKYWDIITVLIFSALQATAMAHIQTADATKEFFFKTKSWDVKQWPGQ